MLLFVYHHGKYISRTIDTGTEEDSMDSPSNDTDCLSPKQTLGLIQEEKRPKDTGLEEAKPAQASPRAAPVAEVKKVTEVAEVAEVASPRKPPSRRRLASVSESLDRAMEELELGLGGARGMNQMVDTVNSHAALLDIDYIVNKYKLFA